MIISCILYIVQVHLVHFLFHFMFLSDEGPTLGTLDFAFDVGSTPTFYILICISTLATKHNMFIVFQCNWSKSEYEVIYIYV